ncbi:netrin receptor unc-5 isoform X2 [Drosophila kikkawai]|uniref:Netrin receptor UNC5 n=1 Tax=Drosophila kikkawai TaxID=30033 RepID=A0ABM4GD33_DROKI
MAVINRAGSVITLLVGLQVICLSLMVTGELPQLDYGSMSASLEEDAIDPLTALAPFANSLVTEESAPQKHHLELLSNSSEEENPARPPVGVPSSSSSSSSSSGATAAGSGTLLEEFNSGKLSPGEASNTLPIFLSEPESVFVVKNRPAILKCKASHSLQVIFKCSGSSQPPPSTHETHVDPHTGVNMEEVTATIHRDLVDEFFGDGPFKCECHAWSSRGVVKSQAATVHIAYIRKSFNQSPTSLRLELGSRAELRCEPPGGFPEPKLTWHKNNAVITAESEPGISVTGGILTFRQVALQHMANYSCSAENIAGRRISDSAVLIVYVNGGWSTWSPWRECKCAGKPSQGRKRSRTCNNPMPLNGGAQCPGPQIQKSADCAACPEDTQIVSPDGFDISSSKRNFDWTLYLGLAFITAVCFAFGAALICCARRGIRTNPHYNMARSVMDADYMPGVVEKKEMRMHIEASNMGYDYVNPGHRYLPSMGMGMGCGSIGGGVTEHHYDVPNLSANYTNPIDHLSVDYLSETGESSAADTSNSTFDMNNKLSILNASKSSSYELLGSSGGQLRLYGGELLLFVPEHAIGKHSKKHVSLLLLSDECSRVSCATESSILCSSVVHSAPRNYSFVKPVILKIPHCLVAPEQWHVHIYHADSEHDELSVNWRRAVSVGEETINTPMFVQLESRHVFIMTEQLGHFAVVAEPRIQQPSIKMKLLAFSQHTPPSSANCSLRIYVVKDLPNSRDICSNVEAKLGGSFLGESQVFVFTLNSRNLNIRVRSADVEAAAPYEHAIPYQHILSNNSILHCEFSLRRQDQTTLCVDFGQGSEDDADIYTFNIPAHSLSGSAEELASTTNTTISIDRQGNYVNESCVMDFVQLPHATKRLICAALDPPRADERDWRLLAKKLNTDRYIAYFATKASPTEQILNLWECRANSSPGNSSNSVSHTIMNLLLTLKEMGRQDVLDIIVETIGPLWF